MSAFDNARHFFAACEEPSGWAGCQAYVEPGAPFVAQSEPLADIDTVEGYCEWMKAFGTVTAAGASYELHAAAWDEANRSALFFATYSATHVGDGGPVPPTGLSTRSHYVYVVTMSDNDKVAAMTKIWNAPWAMRELGWI
ncbi:MAG: hypothetical protein AAF515_13410 [Pseudomonadota bacterium]